MITKEFLESCTDEQINRGVAWLEISSLFGLDGMCGVQKNVCNKALSIPMNYCNTPNDIMPIAFANSIDLASPNTNGTDDWQAYQFDPTFNFYTHSSNTNPLRAICEVYILMSVGK